MKLTLIIKNQDDHVIFKGKPITLPMTKTAVVAKSIELFGDDDPCVIHQSYAIQKIMDAFLARLPGPPFNDMPFKDIESDLSFIDLPTIETCLLTIEVKR